MTATTLFVLLLLVAGAHGVVAQGGGGAPGAPRPQVVDVGVILDRKTWVGNISWTCIELAMEDFYASPRHASYTTRLKLHLRDTGLDAVSAAAADCLSRSGLTPYFIRTAWNDSPQAEAIAALVQRYNWREVIPVFEDDDSNIKFIPDLVDALRQVGTRVSYRCKILPSDKEDDIKRAISSLRDHWTSVFVVRMSNTLALKFFQLAKDEGMMGEGFVWITAYGLTDIFDVVGSPALDVMQGVLGVKPHVQDTMELQNFRQIWRKKYRLENPETSLTEPTVSGLYAYDTIWALALAAEVAGFVNSDFGLPVNNGSTDFDRINTSRPAKKLRDSLLKVNFSGMSGKFQIEGMQLASVNYTIINIVGQKGRVVGLWTPVSGISSSLWSGDNDTPPRGWLLPWNKTLKIGVPMKGGFGEFVRFEGVPKGLLPKGFCINVFQEVVADLPYKLPCNYLPFEDRIGESNGTIDELVYKVYLKFEFFQGMQNVDCTQVRKDDAIWYSMENYGGSGQQQTAPPPSHLDLVPASIDMDEFAVNLSQGSGMSYSQMMQSMDAMHFSQNKMFMITGRSEYVHNSEEDDAQRDNDTCGNMFEPEENSDANGDSAYKYKDTWVNPGQSDQISEKSSCDEQECSQPDNHDNTNDQNVGSADDLAADASECEVRSVEEDGGVQELCQEDIEIYLENESVKATQTCSQEVLVHLNIVHIPDKYFIARWMPREKKDIRDLRYNVPLEMTGECSQMRFNVLSKVCINVASDGSKSNEKYLFVTQEVKKIAEKLDAMTLAEDKAKEVDPKEKSKEQVVDVQTEYGYLNDPKVVKSKGRPTILGKNKLDRRYMTFAEQFLGKQQITCSHCGSHYHNIQTCESLHLDESLFANNKKAKNNPRGKKKTTDESSKKTKKAKEK
ncbi:hypothetical protein ACQ4PT_033389 [Festuca glaucescens]